MSKINPFSKHKTVIQDLFQKTKANQQEVFNLNKFSFNQHTDSFINKFQSVTLDLVPVYYDLYKFLGITYATGATSPTPASAYEEQETEQWYFIYPTIGFAVVAGETPESVTDDVTPWQFQTTVAVIKSLFSFPKMPDWAIDGARHIAYLYKEDGTGYTSSKVILQAKSQDFNEISVDFNDFYRWIKLEDGYNFEYYAIYPLPTSEVYLNTTIYFNNPKNTNYAQSEKI